MSETDPTIADQGADERLLDALMRLDPHPACAFVLRETLAEVTWQLATSRHSVSTAARADLFGTGPAFAPMLHSQRLPEWAVKVSDVSDECAMIDAALAGDQNSQTSTAMRVVATLFWPAFVGDHVGFPGVVEQVALNEAARLPLWHLRGRAPFISQMLWWDPEAPQLEPKVVDGVGVLIAPDLQHSDGVLAAAALRWLRTIIDRAEQVGNARLLHF